MKPSISRADLINFLHHNDEDKLEKIAEFVGYKRREQQKPSSPPPKPTPGGKVLPPKTDPAKDRHHFPQSKQQYQYWYAAEYRLKTPDEVQSEKPQWIDEGEGLRDEEIYIKIRQTPPSTPPLVPWSQLWPFLKNILGRNRESRTIDIPQFVKLVSTFKIITKLPKKQRHCWARFTTILLDFSERLVPFWDDMDKLHRSIEKLRGSSGLQVYSIDYGPDGRFKRRDQPFHPVTDFNIPEPGTPMLIASDLGCFSSASKIKKSWLDFGQYLSKKGLHPIVLTPCPPRYWDNKLQQYFLLIWWDRGQKLPRNYRQQQNRLFTKKISSEQLLTLFSPAIQIEPSLLRTIRLFLPRNKVDSGVEAAVWNHKHVKRNSLTFIFRPQFIAKYRKAFQQQDSALREKIIVMIAKHHTHLLPVIRCEENIIASSLIDKPAQQEIDFMRKFFRTIDNDNFSNQQRRKSWFNRLTERQHSQVWQQNKILTACWFKIHYDDWRAKKVQVKEGMSLDDVAWMIPEQETKEYTILQVGNEFIIHNKDHHKQQDFTIGCPLATIVTTRDYVEKTRIAIDKTANPQTNYVFSTDREEIVIKSMTKPSWVQDIEHDKHGLFMTTPTSKLKLHWFLPGKYHIPGKKQPLVKNTGFWGNRKGVDEYGLYVDFDINGVNLRLRWIKPGTFMMGSPLDESGRQSKETQHQVTLTEGYWLAETVCTQELWAAVMGDNPSYFKGKNRPVENVSWDNCQNFFDKLNAMIGLGFRFPTEAQWEYACRAGTQTAFSFGDNITQKQANYGKKVKDGTVEVKTFPCNNWGLYEMHGNVWEWCYDWYGEYQSGTVVNSTGPTTGDGRCMRGGCFIYLAADIRSASRLARTPSARNIDYGFRVSLAQMKPDDTL